MFENISENENLLHENELGTIIQCINCKKIVIIINNILYNCSETQYENLYNTIQKIDQNLEEYLFEILGKNYIIIDTALDNVNLVFNLNQFEELTELFDHSKYMIDIQNLIN